MRRLKTLHRDPTALMAVGAAAKRTSGQPTLSFGLVCYEAGRVAGRAELEGALRGLVFEVTHLLDAWVGDSRAGLKEAIIEARRSLARRVTAPAIEPTTPAPLRR